MNLNKDMEAIKSSFDKLDYAYDLISWLEQHTTKNNGIDQILFTLMTDVRKLKEFIKKYLKNNSIGEHNTDKLNEYYIELDAIFISLVDWDCQLV